MLNLCHDADLSDVSRTFRWNVAGMNVAEKLIKLDGTPEAVRYFASICDTLPDYDYWFFLSTLWVGYSGGVELDLWKRLFSSDRKHREKCIMKPSELDKFKQLPWFVTVYRAHRPQETDWIAYTIDPRIAARFARERGADKVMEYRVKKRDILALFLRRNEAEILILNKEKVKFVREIMVIIK
ncbi:MAG: hypothetical protein ABFC57_12790 [Veillonellales bacterium]